MQATRVRSKTVLLICIRWFSGRAKKAVKEEDAAEEADEAPKPAAKKGRKAKDSVVEESEAAPAPKATKGRKTKSVPTSDTIAEDDAAAPPPKKTTAKKAAAASAKDVDDGKQSSQQRRYPAPSTG